LNLDSFFIEVKQLCLEYSNILTLLGSTNLERYCHQENSFACILTLLGSTNPKRSKKNLHRQLVVLFL